MIRLLKLPAMLLIVFRVAAQETPDEYYDKASYSVSLLKGFPYGRYREYMQSGNDPASTFGVSVAYLINPFARRGRNSKLFAGGEAGYQGNKQKDIINHYGGNFYISHSEYWLSMVLRYRPILWSSVINPYVDAAAGPRLYNFRIMERVSEEEIYKIDGMNSVALNLSLGAGIGIKVSPKDQAAKYIDLGFYLSGSNPAGIIDRRSVIISQAAEVSFEKKVVRPDEFQVRIGLTGFL